LEVDGVPTSVQTTAYEGIGERLVANTRIERRRCWHHEAYAKALIDNFEEESEPNRRAGHGHTQCRCETAAGLDERPIADSPVPHICPGCAGGCLGTDQTEILPIEGTVCVLADSCSNADSNYEDERCRQTGQQETTLPHTYDPLTERMNPPSIDPFYCRAQRTEVALSEVACLG
jgi:hypothetical protein